MMVFKSMNSTLVTTLSYGTNFLTFDDLRSKLIHYEQHLEFLKSKDLVNIQHSTLTTSITSSELGKRTSNSTFTRANGSGYNRNNRRNNNRKRIGIKGAEIETSTSNSINLPTGACL